MVDQGEKRKYSPPAPQGNRPGPFVTDGLTCGQDARQIIKNQHERNKEKQNKTQQEGCIPNQSPAPEAPLSV
jgi:hypothetical protein